MITRMIRFIIGSLFLVASLSGQEKALPGTDYRLVTNDLVNIEVYNEPETRTVQRISASGEIAVPMLGSVKVVGLTLREAEKLISDLYVKGEYFVKPQVVMSMQAYVQRSVSIMGQVNRPGQIDFQLERETMGLIQAVTMAGGFTRVAKLDAIKVIRTTETKEEQISVNVAAYLESKGSVNEFKLIPGDIVFVPERVF